MSFDPIDAQADEPTSYDFSNPSRVGDVVMKGGITSGVIYPWAVCELAQTYRFKNIGGTSAGAIASAATAAAEYGRHAEGAGAGFRGLAALPAWIATGRNLFSLFQPSSGTRPLFNLLAAGLGHSRTKVFRLAAAAILNFPIAVLLGLVPGGSLIVIPIVTGAHGLLLVWCVTLGAVLLLPGALLGLAVAAAVRTGRAIPANDFGLCSGHATPRRGRPLALVDWLAEELERLAGRPADSPVPLTFGHLWLGRERAPDDQPAARAAEREAMRRAELDAELRSINLEMMTTNLTQGRPYRMPFDGRWLFFERTKFSHLFPERIVGWMETHPPEPADDEPLSVRRDWELLCRLLAPRFAPFPAPADVPVVVAARLSLSFPLLISAIPLWSVDYGLKVNQAERGERQVWMRDHAEEWDRLRDDDAFRAATPPRPPSLSRSWFSDGGITSNFPVHFFDALLPRWPTFGMNLRGFHPDHPQDSHDECENVYLPRRNAGGITEWFTPVEPQGLRGLTGFLHSIADTMQNWRDNAQMRVPGYRDRVAHVSYNKLEGGMNLDMPPETIDKLTNRGRCAGAALRRRFAFPPEDPRDLSWDNQRWVRYRVAMSVLQSALSSYRRAYDQPAGPDETSYPTLVARDPGVSPSSYQWARAAQREFAHSATDDLMELVESWQPPKTDQAFTEDAPRPSPVLRVVPRV
jgi:Patatin-like phospholipase